MFWSPKLKAMAECVKFLPVCPKWHHLKLMQSKVKIMKNFLRQANRFDAFYANGSKGLGNADSEQYFLPRTRKDQENLKLSKKRLDLRG